MITSPTTASLWAVQKREGLPQCILMTDLWCNRGESSTQQKLQFSRQHGRQLSLPDTNCQGRAAEAARLRRGMHTASLLYPQNTPSVWKAHLLLLFFFFFMANTDFPEFMPKKPGGRLHDRRGFWFICQHFLLQLWRSTENCLLGFTNVSSAKKRNPPYSNMSPETSFHKYYMLHNPENTCGCCKCFLSWY